MPRRRSASPAPRAPAPQPRTMTQYQAPPTAVAQPQQPGLMKQMAATAGGVAIGSAVGHTIGHALTGGIGSQAPAAAPPAQIGGYDNPSTLQNQNPCQYQIDQLISCTSNQQDLNLCNGFAETLKECRRLYSA